MQRTCPIGTRGASTVLVKIVLVCLLATMTRNNPEQLTVYVGDTLEVDVGFKIGFVCDNTEILRAWMVTEGETNVFIVQGVAPGGTWCRVGTAPGAPSFLFDIDVEPKP